MSTPQSNISFEALPLSSTMIADLRSDHAGETGAVMIYRGILAVTRSPGLREFAHEHLKTEILHRQFFDDWLPGQHHSRLLVLWRAAGWVLGALSAVFGSRCVYRTIAAVECFVERHYQEQIQDMRDIDALKPLVDTLKIFCAEEVTHRDDAARRLSQTPGWLGRSWCRLVGGGSALGVRIARLI